MKTYEVVVIDYETMAVTKSKSFTDESKASKHDDALNINLNHNKYYTEIRVHQEANDGR